MFQNWIQSLVYQSLKSLCSAELLIVLHNQFGIVTGTIKLIPPLSLDAQHSGNEWNSFMWVDSRNVSIVKSVAYLFMLLYWLASKFWIFFGINIIVSCRITVRLVYLLRFQYFHNKVVWASRQNDVFLKNAVFFYVTSPSPKC